jgi:hypothetical protein
MAKMYGDRGRECWDSPENYTKSMIKAREERQWRKEAEAEELVPGECPHVTSVREDVEGLKACDSCTYDQSLYVERIHDGVQGT